MKRALRWLRLDDDHGTLSLSNVALAVGIGFLFVGRTAPFVAGVCLCGISMLIGHWQTHLAMEGAQEAALTQMEHEHEIAKAQETPLTGRIAALERKVHELASPERLDALSRMGGGRKAGA
jgi:hypothetical protein